MLNRALANVLLSMPEPAGRTQAMRLARQAQTTANLCHLCVCVAIERREYALEARLTRIYNRAVRRVKRRHEALLASYGFDEVEVKQ
jgi:hypothetical protein